MSPASVPEQCRKQAQWCQRLGSPLYAHLLEHCAEEYEGGGGALRDLLQPYSAEPPGLSLPLRLMGAVHRLVLEHKAPELARYYPSAGGWVDLDAAWDAFLSVVRENTSQLHPLLARPVQTNDAGRSGSLLGGFFLVAQQTGLPLRLLEIGASAGLNLCWDRYRYEWNSGNWGDPDSPVRLTDVFRSGTPPVPPALQVATRAGCDLDPLDVCDPAARLTLLAYTWPDQVERINRLEAAISIARKVPYHVEQAGAADWLPSQLDEPAPGTATVVFHSIVWPYLSSAERERVTALIEDAGRRATPSAPLAWLRMEPGSGEAEVRLRIDPGLAEQVIATTSFHTPAVVWNA
jgi:hypothetical protein